MKAELKNYTLSLSDECMKPNEWIIDSGATVHMTPNENLFSKLDNTHRSDVIVANGEKIQAVGVGTVPVKLKDGTMVLKDVLFVPRLETNLISVRKLTANGSKVSFEGGSAYIELHGVKVTIGKTWKNHFYLMQNEEMSMLVKEDKFCVHEWHRRFSHRNLRDIQEMKKHGLEIIPCNCSDTCEDCLRGKMARKPFPKESRSEHEVLDLIVSDVCGPMPTQSIGHCRYFVTFIDYKSGYCEVRFLKEKGEAAVETINFIERMKNQVGKKPKIFRSDRGTEYINKRLQDYLKQEGIRFECTVGFCPEQNGKAERKNRTLMEAARTMLSESKLSQNHWAEAVNTANFVQNQITNSNGVTPFEMVFNKKPHWNILKRFGCPAQVMIPYEKRKKLDMKSELMWFVGYDEQSKGYRLTNKRRIIISREVHFLDDEKIPGVVEPAVTEIEGPAKNVKEVMKEQTVNDAEKEEDEENFQEISLDIENPQPPVNQVEADEEIVEENPVEADEENQDEFVSADEGSENDDDDDPPVDEGPRRSQRATQGIPPTRFNDYVTYEVENSTNEPKSYQDAMNSIHAEEWKAAIQTELNNMEKNAAWDVTTLPNGKTSIGSKWVFKEKKDDKGNVVERKARLVAQGFSQKYGRDFDEVFAPVARGATMRLLLSYAGSRKYLVKQYDIKAAFLNGELTEEIFMRPPQGLELNGEVLRLRKSIYGLKQAARTWNQTLHKSLTKNGCIQNKTDTCLYSVASGGSRIYLMVHVDDILAATNDEPLLDELMKNVNNDFEIKCLGEARQYLGIQLDRDSEGHFLISQPNYIAQIVEAAGMTEAKSSKFPLDTGYYKLEGKLIESNELYRKLIGMYLFLAINTRPDISASVAILSQKVTKPTDTDLNEVKRIARYLKATQHLKLRLSSSGKENQFITFADADWAENNIDRKSNSGMFCTVNGGAISWSCRKQSLVALSTAEAEYIALSEACKEVLWIKEVTKHFEVEHNRPALVYTDNQSAIALVDNPKFSNRTKHINAKYHFIKDLVEKDEVMIRYHPTSTNIADMLTKPLGGEKIKQLRTLAGLEEELTQSCRFLDLRRNVGTCKSIESPKKY